MGYTLLANATLSEHVNAIIDGLLATASRLLDLPLFVVLGATGVLALMLIILAGRFSKRASLARNLRYSAAAIAILSVIFIIDRKIARLQDQVTALEAKSSNQATALLNAVAKKESKRQSLLFNTDEAQKQLSSQFSDVTLRPLVYDEATDTVQVHIGNPLTQAFLAIIDLRHPHVQIKIGAGLQNKTLTTAFARENDCTVAINGEAGMSPDSWSGLGVWRGNLVSMGQSILSEEPRNLRPFLSFDRQNRAGFAASTAARRKPPDDAYNVIWGRLDSIIDGQVQTGDERYRQPRTAMGINQDGTKLYLLVVDGRQPRYSNGFTRAEVGQFLKAFGAHNGMLCDEGGSSCIYLKQFGGISNIPSDNQGQERPTYTHFGIAMSKSE